MWARFILSGHGYNDRCAIANAAVPAGFAGFPAAERFIRNADLNGGCGGGVFWKWPVSPKYHKILQIFPHINHFLLPNI
jgi:hypothetical protein